MQIRFNGGGQQTTNQGDISLNIENAQNGTVQYKIGESGDWQATNGGNFTLRRSEELKDATSGTAILFKVTPNPDQSLDTNQRQNWIEINGQGQTDIDTTKLLDGSYSIIYNPANTYSMQIKFNGGEPGPEPGPEPGDEPAHGGYEGDEKISTVTITGKADFYINDSRMVNGNDGDTFDNVSYHYDGNGYVDFYFDCFINERYTSLKINGVDYYSQLPTPDTPEGREALLAACKGQINEFKIISVPYSESYAIESSVKWLDDTDKDYMVVGNFLWTYTDQNQGDDYIDHGRMELLNVNYNDEDYSPDDLNNPGTAKDWSQDENGGSAVLPVGAVVTVKLVPDYGYQLTSFGINGGNFGTGDEQSTFTFEIRPGNAHLGAHFTHVEDKVSSEADFVSEGNIQLGENEINTGSVVLSVGNAAEDVNEDGFQNALAQNEEREEYEIASVLDINLNQVIYKGTEDPDNVWSNGMTELHNDATITLKLNEEYTNAVIVHETHEGDYEVIDTTYNPEDGTITFKTDSFSNYAVAVVSECAHTLTLVPAKDSTCTEAGNKAYYTCDGCDKWFEDATGAVEITDHSSVVIPAQGHTASGWKSDAANHWKECNVVGCGVIIEGSKAAHSYGNDNVCDICGYTKPVTPPSYSVIEGANSSWTMNTDGTLTFRANGDFSKFTGVKVDDTLIDANNYTAASGSTVITLKADYLKTLPGGTHKLTVVYTDGECSTNYEVKKATSEQTESIDKPKSEVKEVASEQTEPIDTTKLVDSQSPKTGDNSNLALWFALLFVSGVGILGTVVYRRKKRAE